MGRKMFVSAGCTGSSPRSRRASWSPGVYDQKIYAPGLGIVAEHALAGNEDAVLVNVSPAP